MAKNLGKKNVRKDEPMNGAMKFFLAGCVAELYLLIIRRFYINAASDLIRIAWYDRYLWVAAGLGAAVLVLGAVGALTVKKRGGRDLWYVAGVGAFMAVSSLLVRWNMATLSLMTVLVPVVMLLSILWALYDRECALALTVLGVSLLALWGFRRYGASIYAGTAVKAALIVYLAVVAALAALTYAGKLGRLLSPRADRLPVYVSCGISAVALLAALLISGMAYYAMWALAAVEFALAVYYTVKQL